MERKHKILIFLAVWKRPHITELCFKGIQRLRQHPDFDIEAMAVISEPEMEGLCKKYGIYYCFHENEPLGAKKNYGLKMCRGIEFDYLMEIGSDDLILNELMDSYTPHLGEWDFFGISDAAYIHSTKGFCRRLKSKATYGAGRMISREALDAAGWTLWADGINKGMDNNSVLRFQKLGIPYHKVTPMDFPGVIDVKSDVNIWKYDHFLGDEYDKGEIYSRLSVEEVEMLESFLCYKVDSI